MSENRSFTPDSLFSILSEVENRGGYISHSQVDTLKAALCARIPPLRPEWDGWVRFQSECKVNGVTVPAGTAWGPFEKSRDVALSERGTITEYRPGYTITRDAAPQGSPVQGHDVGVPSIDPTKTPAVAAFSPDKQVLFSSWQDPRSWDVNAKDVGVVITCATNADAKKAERLFNDLLARAEKAEQTLSARGDIEKAAMAMEMYLVESGQTPHYAKLIADQRIRNLK